MPSAIEKQLDAQLARIINQIRHIRELNLADEAERERALAESLEALRTMTMYRGTLKNVSEQHFASSNAALSELIDKS